MMFMITFVLLTFQSICVLTSTVDLSSRPEIIEQPPAVVYWAENRGGYVECKTSGDPQPTVTWITLEGQVINTIPGLRHVLVDGTIVFGARTSTLDAGSITIMCRASNTAGTLLSRPVTIQPVSDRVMISKIKQLTSARIGSNLVLRCELDASISRTIEINWFKDGLLIPNIYQGDDARWIVGADGMLIGRELTSIDLRSEFTCSAGTSSSEMHKLNIEDGAGLNNAGYRESLNIEAFVGDTVVLPCLIDITSDALVSWYKSSERGEGGESVVGARGVIVLRSVTTQHSATWSCTAGQHTTSVVLRVILPLRVQLTPRPLMLVSGESGRFRCTVTSEDENGQLSDEVRWWRDGRTLSLTMLHRSDHDIDVGPMKIDMIGLYQCTVRRRLESAVGTSELITADTPPQFLNTFRPVVWRVDNVGASDVSLWCSAAGRPTPRIIWTLDGRPLPTSAAHKYKSGTVHENEGIRSWLNITVSGPEEGGLYTCNATNTRGSIAHSARLDVYGPPYIRFLPPVHAIADTEVILYCPYSGYPIKEVRWSREGETSGVSVRSEGDGRAAVRDGGSYVCHVEGLTGEVARRTLHLILHKMPKLTPFFFPDGVEVGSGVQATCAVLSGDKPIHFTWYKDDLPVQPSLKVAIKNMDFFSLLIIAEVTSSHSGNYTCRATNSIGSASQSAILQIREPPSWLWRGTNTSAISGASIILPCSARGRPQPTIQWHVDVDGSGNWREAESAGGAQWMQLSDGSGWLRSARPHHAGWYRCTASSGSHQPLQHTLYLHVHEPPNIERSGGERISVRRDTDARLQCVARGESSLLIMWMRAHQPLIQREGVSIRESRTGRRTTSELIITSVNTEHEGQYTCRAHDMYGDDELVYTLIVQDKPEAPTEMSAREVWSRRVRIVWRRPRDGHSAISTYTLQFEEHDIRYTHQWSSSRVSNLTVPARIQRVRSDELLDHDLDETVLSSLRPARRYAIRIAANNDVGRGPYSQTLYVTTAEEAPGAAPVDVKVKAIRPKELHVTWKAPGRESWHGELLGYVVRWGETNGGGAGEQLLRGVTHDTFTITGLTHHTRYSVTVAAYNSAARGPPSPAITTITLQGAPESPVLDVKCSDWTPRSLRIAWRAPDSPGGPLTGYTMRYSYSGHTHASHLLRIQGEQTTLNGLDPYTEYSIQVRAHTAIGEGPYSEPTLCRTLEDVPSQPAGLKVCAVSERALRATWLPPGRANGHITHYTIYYNDFNGSNKGNSTRVEPELIENENSKVIRGLRSDRTYEVWVTASTSIGEGAPSDVVSCKPTSTPPARITSFGGVVTVSVSDPVRFRCDAVGTPMPSKRWLKANIPIKPGHHVYFDDDTLSIRAAELSHSDNYTCVAENIHGSDTVQWSLRVLRPPAPPLLSLTAVRHTQLDLELISQPSQVDRALATRYSIHWRRDDEPEWRYEPASLGTHTLRGLRCGTAYRVATSADGGLTGRELAARTSGSPPRAPSNSRWLLANDTTVWADANAWDDGGCGPVTITLEIRGIGKARDFLSGLSPATTYEVIAEGFNEAGRTRAVYELTTSGVDGSIGDSGSVAAAEGVILLAALAALAVAALTLTLVLLRRKRTIERLDNEDKNRRKQEKGFTCGTFRPSIHSPTKLPDPPDVYEISPYATFGGGVSEYALRSLDAPSRTPAPCCEAEETCLSGLEGKRRRTRRQRSHYYPDINCSHDSGS